MNENMCSHCVDLAEVLDSSEHNLGLLCEEAGLEAPQAARQIFCYMADCVLQKCRHASTMTPDSDLLRAEQINCRHRDVLQAMVAKYFPGRI